MKKLTAEQQAFGILNEFHPDDLAMILNHVHAIRKILKIEEDVIEDSSIISKNLASYPEYERGVNITLLAIYLQRISKQHGRKFKKIAVQFSEFENICDKICEKENRALSNGENKARPSSGDTS